MMATKAFWHGSKLQSSLSYASVKFLSSSANSTSSGKSCRRPETPSMSAWITEDYSMGAPDLRLKTDVPVPTVTSPDEVLVHVRAASVNPLDVQMSAGYGRTFLASLRAAKKCQLASALNPPYDELPLVLGRDFSGEVVARGCNVNHVRVGDDVWGVALPSQVGTHAQFAVVSSHMVSAKPSGLNDLEATAVPYAGVTAFTALRLFAGVDDISRTGARPESALVLGASGGVGHIALQLLKAWGHRVTALCSGNAFEMVSSLGADCVVDYRDADARQKLLAASPKGKGFDVILDCAGVSNPSSYGELLKPWTAARFVTLSSPVLRLFNDQGPVLGSATSAATLVSENAHLMAKCGATCRWAYFVPIPGALEHLASLVQRDKLRVILDSTYSFADVPEAFERVGKGSLRGKTVIKVNMT